MLKGGVHCFSVYLKDSDGLSDTNQTILTELAAMVDTVQGPWIIGGDWNMTPDKLASSNWPNIVQGRIHVPSEPTCNDSVYDYFVVSNSLSHAVQATVRLSDGGCSPHWTTRLYLSGAVRHKAIRRLVKPARVPADLPFGPLRHCDVIRPQSDHGPHNDLASDFNSWYKRARDTWHSLLGTTPNVSERKFRWEAASGRIACPDAGAEGPTKPRTC